MNLLRLSLAYIRARALNAGLNVLLLGLGVATIVVLLLFTHQLEQRLERDSRGIDLVVGAKGSPLQLILSSVYHVDIPTGNISLADAEKLKTNPLIKASVPLALGDSYEGFRIVGTDHDYVSLYDGKAAKGRLWEKPYEAVLGSEVAAHARLNVGEKFVGSHGLVEGGEKHEHSPYTIVGILAPSGSVLDRLVLTSVESVWEIHGQGPHEEDEDEDEKSSADPSKPKHLQPQELTALLVQYASPMAAAMLPRQVNSQSALQAASPAFESARLLNLVGVGVQTVQAFALILILCAGLSVFIALYNALRERSYDLAVMRSLGASRGKLFAAILIEGLILASAGVVLGLVLGHVLTEVLGAWLHASQRVYITGWALAPGELALVVAALAVGLLSALLPAVLAYRTDIGEVLARR
ncbi:MAG TPA: FtsX-like permease family protein [Burkholderiales bacterium]|nr:FtsX-like permease family protein [Burkholderiales bacterium]